MTTAGVRLLLGAGLTFMSAGLLAGQQREPALEVYGLLGGYFHGNLSIRETGRLQYGGGLLLPVGRSWAVLIDATTSSTGTQFRLFPGGGALARERRLAILPSAVRLWRRERFSIYAGAGLGFEHERRHSSIVPVAAPGPGGQPIPPAHAEDRRSARTDAMLALRAGVVVSLTRRVVWRTGYSLLPRYVDEKPSQSLESGIGYRF